MEVPDLLQFVVSLVHERIQRLEFRAVCSCDLLDVGLQVLVDVGFVRFEVCKRGLLCDELSGLVEHSCLGFERGGLEFGFEVS